MSKTSNTRMTSKTDITSKTYVTGKTDKALRQVKQVG